MNIIAKPYKLINQIQNYDWGTKNENAFIPNLLGIDAVNDLPYAELWIGAHPKAPSEILVDGNKYSLNRIIENYPIEILGKYIAEKFGSKLPFLLKVLSAANALSIQTHPNKEQAKRLHLSDPENYPDDNHKPEIAIAVDSLTALVGFRPVKEIKTNLMNIPEMIEYTGKDIIDKILFSNDEEELAVLIKNLYKIIMKQASEKEILIRVIEKLVNRFSGKQNLSPEEYQFLKQNKLFGVDVGLFSFFFFNFVQLKPGQAIFTEAGVPHAYIEGNIIECMANSDNVIRAGLTNKFKDVETLLDILNFNFTDCKIINEDRKYERVIYKTSAEEFEITGFQNKSESNQLYNSENRPVVILIIEGAVIIDWKNEDGKQSERFSKGESFLVPANLKEFNLTCTEGSRCFMVKIP